MTASCPPTCVRPSRLAVLRAMAAAGWMPILDVDLRPRPTRHKKKAA